MRSPWPIQVRATWRFGSRRHASFPLFTSLEDGPFREPTSSLRQLCVALAHEQIALVPHVLFLREDFKLLIESALDEPSVPHRAMMSLHR